MGALANATILRKDPEFRSWVETGIAYQARVVMSEATSTADHAVRMQMAQDAAVQPVSFLDLFVTAIATDPAVASKGATANDVTEQLVLDKVAALWTAIAKIRYPAA